MFFEIINLKLIILGMMLMIIDKDEVKEKKIWMFRDISKGSVFIYPTDTIYGLGCDSMHDSSINKLRHIKGNIDHPFSIIVPSKNWIKDNCEISENAYEWIDKLPGPYTLIFTLKNKKLFPESLTKGLDTVGVRIPDHWISEFVGEYGLPIVTTSANKAGEMFMTNTDDLDIDIKNSVHFIVYEGEKIGKPSKVVDLSVNIR